MRRWPVPLLWNWFGGVVSELHQEEEGVMSSLKTFCPHLDEIPQIFTTFWQRLHSSVVQLEHDISLDVGTPDHETRALCVQLGLLRSIIQGQAGMPFPQAVNSCPTLMAIYFEWASGLAEEAPHPRRARGLLQLAAPLQLMALSRALMRPDESREFKDRQRAVSSQFSQKLQKLRGNTERRPWQLGSADRPRVVVRSLCDATFGGGNLENGSFNVTERNHRSYAETWGYDYEMLFQRPKADEEPQFGKLQVALDVLSQDAPDWFLWLDCDSLVTNRSISISDLVKTYDIGDAHFVVAEETSGINSGVFLLRGGEVGLRFLRKAMNSDWRFVWDQTMLLHQMAMDSDLLGQEMCSKWRKAEDESRDFNWAQHLRVVPQHALNLYGEGSALQWGASAWQRGDFILHLAGCPLVETPCREVFEDVARWVEEVH